MEQQGLAVHETLELHEILVFKNVCMTKSKAMQGIAQDDDLKQLLQEDVRQSSKAVNSLQSLLARANLQ